MELKGKKFDGLTIGELAALRRGLRTLDPMVIVDISKELMKTDLIPLSGKKSNLKQFSPREKGSFWNLFQEEKISAQTQ